jgi:7-keto-8-aminopelargonate synthetase-like enzyme
MWKKYTGKISGDLNRAWTAIRKQRRLLSLRTNLKVERWSTVDQDGTFYADANYLGLAEHKPSKESISRLAEETKKGMSQYINTTPMCSERVRKTLHDRGSGVEMAVLVTYHTSTKETKCLIKTSHGMQP